jgi:ATPase subunit of ABC transporter with duplicated ATPase domains
LPALIWLEDFLQKSPAAVIVVSHDRRFLDRVTRKILELDWHSRTLTATGGTYSEYLIQAAKKLARQKEEYRHQEEEIERLKISAREKREAAERGRSWEGSDNDTLLRGFKRDRAKSSARTAKAIVKRIDQMEKVERPREREPLAIPLAAGKTPGDLDIRLEGALAGYDSGFRLGPLSLEVRFGQRIGIIGLNGSGKSTLLKLITGGLAPLEGEVSSGANIRFGNLMQEHESLPREEVPARFLMTRAGLSEPLAYNQLIKFGFTEMEAKRPIGNLSPGGRARLLLALFSAQAVTALVLDEPTNHLDLEALDALEEALENYEGTVILVSHDRYFLEKSRLDYIYLLEEGKLTPIPDYRDYVAHAETRAKKLLKIVSSPRS